MDVQKRLNNEKHFEDWTEKKDGGRIYYFQVPGKYGWFLKYLKETDEDEITLRFWQEIYDEKRNLREIHEKYPIDEGHKKLI